MNGGNSFCCRRVDIVSSQFPKKQENLESASGLRIQENALLLFRY